MATAESSVCRVSRLPAGGGGAERAAPGDPVAAPASNSAAYGAGKERQARPRPLLSDGGGSAGAGPEHFHWPTVGPSRLRTRQDPSQKSVRGLLLQPGVSPGNGDGAGLRAFGPAFYSREECPAS